MLKIRATIPDDYPAATSRFVALTRMMAFGIERGLPSFTAPKDAMPPSPYEKTWHGRSHKARHYPYSPYVQRNRP